MEIVRFDTVNDYNEFFGVPSLHPLVNVVDFADITRFHSSYSTNYGIYAIFLKDVRCGDIRYGRQVYDYQDGTIVSFAPGQVVTMENVDPRQPMGRGLVFHPDLIRGTSLGREIEGYSFLSYNSNEALHLSDDERKIISDCLDNIKAELARPIDKLSKRLLARNIQLLLDYCMRFYSRQFETRSTANHDVLSRFEKLLDEYFRSDQPQMNGLPTVRYFADKVFLSPNYFGDLIKKETGKTPIEYIQDKLINTAKDLLLGTDKPVNEIADELGFQYSQHFNRVFKKISGFTPTEYRKTQNS